MPTFLVSCLYFFDVEALVYVFITLLVRYYLGFGAVIVSLFTLLVNMSRKQLFLIVYNQGSGRSNRCCVI